MRGSSNARAARLLLLPNARTPRGVKLVKRQVNGSDQVVLKRDASSEDLHVEAARLQRQLGYHLELQNGRYLATHEAYRGEYVLELVPD